MKKAKYENKAVPARKSASVRSLALLLALVLLLGGVIGGTIAWLTAKTTEVKNTFSTSDITIELKEHEYDPATDALIDKETTTGVNNYKMIPGWTIPKDPWATVKAGSEDAYLFVEVTEAGGVVTYTPAGSETPVTTEWSDFLSYGIADGWTLVPNETNVYYRTVMAANTDSEFPILAGNKVTVVSEVTKEMMNALDANTYPTLSFTAYAIQLKNTNAEGGTTWDAAQAWAAISG